MQANARRDETLVEGTDYTVTVPAGRKEVGIYEYTITGKSNYAGAVKKNFTIR